VKTSLWTREALKWGIANGDLEAVGPRGEAFVGWRASGQGYQVDSQVRHSGRLSARCCNTSKEDRRGLACDLRLNQRVATPILAEGWSRADGVSMGKPREYALCVEGEYADGTRLGTRYYPFKSGTHAWQRCRFEYVPPKPIKQASLHALLDQRTGTAWFDDLQLWSLELPADTALFDGIPVERSKATVATARTGITLKTGDGLEVGFRGETGQLVTRAPGGLILRDAEALSHFVQPIGALKRGEDGSLAFEGEDEALGLHLSATYRVVGDAIRIDATVRDLTGRDRAITAYFAYPVDAVGWLWHDDQRTSRRIETGGKYSNYVVTEAGLNDYASRYPFACITGQTEGLVLGAPIDVPRLYRFAYDADARQLYAAVDLGLSRDATEFPSAASFSLILCSCDPAWGFRSALKRYYDLFPQGFTKRTAKEGLWLNRTHADTIEGSEDFGFQFMKPNTNVLSDEAHGIYSFVYIEPMSLWLHMPPEMERTPERAIAYLKELAGAPDSLDRAGMTSALEDPNGEWHEGLAVLPDWSGYLFTMNPDPDLPGPPPYLLTQAQRRFRSIEYAVHRAKEERAPWRMVGPGGQMWQRGYTLVPGEGRDGSVGMQMERQSGEERAGAVQTVTTEVAAGAQVTARVWTRAAGVTGGNSDTYCLYVAAEYTDGTAGGVLRMWAETGATEWRLLEKTAKLDKPVRALQFHLLFGKPHTGTVWSDDAFLGLGGSDQNLLAMADFEPDPRFPGASLDGVYLDTFELWGMERNYRREHWAAADTPLVFDSAGRVCQFMLFPTLELAQEVAGRMHGQGKMTFANGTPRSFPWGAPWLDVMGHEINWAPDGKYTPEPDAVMNYRRAICYQRPYLLLMHTNYEAFPTEWMELWMKRSTAYGFFPSPSENLGAATEYWQNPKLYNRDRPLFRKYVPVIQALSAAGWQPITYARSSNPQVYLERFGDPGGPLYVTVFNDSNQGQPVQVSLDAAGLGLTPTTTVTEVLGGEPWPLANGQLRPFTLAAQDAKVLRFGNPAP